MTRTLLAALLCTRLLCAQTDPAYTSLERAYAALRTRDYDPAIAAFREAITITPNRADIRKDLGYTLLKTGDTTAARDQFREAVRLDPADSHLALEYAFLCYETKAPIEARRVFQHLAEQGNETAVTAFENVDRPLREGITRWQQAVAQEPANFSAHEELARLAELRDQFDLAAAEYETAWHLRPPRRDLLLDLGRVWREQGRTAQSNAALLAASRGAEPRVAETARALLPDHYPYVYEFENALQLDPTNAELRRELAYLHQAMGNTPAAAQQFEQLPERAPVAVVAQPALLDRAAPSLDAKWMGERSLEKGFLNDAARYLHSAHESDPSDFNVMLKLGWTHNMLRQDREAVRWFDLARRSPDVITAQEAAAAYRSLSATTRRVRTSAWMFPMISTRWKNAFAYAQVKAELLDKPVHPYASVRFIGDLRGPIRPFVGAGPQYLSERSAIFAIGVNATTWHGATPWFEIGRAISYQTGAGQADLRGGVSYAKTVHRYKWFAETNDDLLYVSRFNKDTLLYSQNHAGWSVNDAIQVFWNANLNTDVKREYWANTTETGPGVRWRFQKVQLSVNFLRGVYLKNTGNPYRPNYNDIRIGAWYAFSR